VLLLPPSSPQAARPTANARKAAMSVATGAILRRMLLLSSSWCWAKTFLVDGK
jgi:hypothetical protein